MPDYASNLRRPPRTLTELEQTRLLKVTGQHADGGRDHVLFAMALGTGMREHEIVSLDVGDVFDAEFRSRRRIRLRVFKRSRDDDSGQEVLLSETLRAKLEKLRRWKISHDEDVAPRAPLFVSRKGNRLSTRQVRHAFRVWQQRAGFERACNVHMLRHSACSNMYRRTRDIRLVQMFARHASIVTSGIYVHPTPDDLLRAVQDLPC